jgi:hypothetical protein
VDTGANLPASSTRANFPQYSPNHRPLNPVTRNRGTCEVDAAVCAWPLERCHRWVKSAIVGSYCGAFARNAAGTCLPESCANGAALIGMDSRNRQIDCLLEITHAGAWLLGQHSSPGLAVDAFRMRVDVGDSAASPAWCGCGRVGVVSGCRWWGNVGGGWMGLLGVGRWGVLGWRVIFGRWVRGAINVQSVAEVSPGRSFAKLVSQAADARNRPRVACGRRRHSKETVYF